jgi:DNA-binding phage protein
MREALRWEASQPMGEDSTAPRIVTQLRQAIRDSKLSLNELGRRTGVSQGQLSRFLRGDRTLTLPAAASVCDYFGLELCPRHAPDAKQS